MTTPTASRVRVEAPAGWRRVPPSAVPGLAAGRPGMTFVLTGDRGIVQGWAVLRLVPRTDADPERAAAAAARILGGEGEDGEVAVWHREVTRVEAASDPAVLMADLLVVDRGAGVREAHRRAVVARFPAEPVCLHLTVSTPASDVLGDLTGTALAFAAAIDLGPGDADVRPDPRGAS